MQVSLKQFQPRLNGEKESLDFLLLKIKKNRYNKKFNVLLYVLLLEFLLLVGATHFSSLSSVKQPVCASLDHFSFD